MGTGRKGQIRTEGSRYLRTEYERLYRFSAIIRKYVGIKELTLTIVNEFIKKIIVHAPEKVDGKRAQKVDIVFNFVEEINFLSDTQSQR
ncbi:MAG: DUF4368 domain-containing protein [Roseburia sp.]|nr:DUF4368 domain-containing protein [Roseburia sp.]MCM1278583.1 DUF4368 domain-containing protein [Robinsoniella sp.]